MKRTKKLIILGVVLVALCGVIVAEKVITRHVDKINTIDEQILSVDAEALSSVKWTSGEEGLEFVKGEEAWQSADDENFPVSQELMEEFLAHFVDVRASFIIDDVEDYGQYGLDEPECVIEFVSGETTVAVSLGGFSTMDSKRYVSVGGEQVYLIDDDLMEYVTTARDDFMNHDEVPEFAVFTEMTVDGDAALDVVYDEEGVYCYTDDYNYYQLADGSHLPLKDSTVEDFVGGLEALDLTDYATYTASSEDLSAYGLDTPAFTIDLKGKDGTGDDASDVELILHVGAVEGELEEDAEEGAEPPVTGYARFDGSEIIYNLTEDQYETLAGVSYDSLRPAEVLSLDWDDEVTSVSFDLDGETFGLEKSAEGEAQSEADVAAWADDYAEIWDAADALTISEFTDETPELQLELGFTVSLSNESYPGIAVEIYRYDGESCLVTFDGQPLGFLERSLMVDLKEAVTTIMLGTENSAE